MGCGRHFAHAHTASQQNVLATVPQHSKPCDNDAMVRALETVVDCQALRVDCVDAGLHAAQRFLKDPSAVEKLLAYSQGLGTVESVHSESAAADLRR
jgi:hypothetical protein